MKTLTTFLLFNVLATSISLAGPSTSGGGIGVLCKTPTAQKLMLLDLFEMNLFGQKLVQSTGSLDGDYTVGLQSLRSLGGDFRPVSQVDIDQMHEMMNKYSELVAYNLTPPGDTGYLVPLPSNCHYEQVAVYQDHEDKLLINKSLWLELDVQNQAALILHESVYRMQRVAFYVDSFQARRMVRELFLANGPTIKGVYDGLVKGKGLLCFAGDSGTNNSFTFVWQDYEIHLLSLAGESRFVKTTLKTLVSVEDVKLERTVIDDVEPAYKIASTPFDFSIKSKYFQSDFPISHISWNQNVVKGEIFTVGMNVRGRVINLPVTSCFKY